MLGNRPQQIGIFVERDKVERRRILRIRHVVKNDENAFSVRCRGNYWPFEFVFHSVYGQFAGVMFDIQNGKSSCDS